MPNKFSTSIKGYNKGEVNEFVNNMTIEYESMLERLKKTDDENKKLNSELEQYKNIESSLRRALVIAEESNRNLRKLSKDESDAIIEEAKQNASRIVNDALIKAEKIENDTDNIKRRVGAYRRQMKQLLEEQNNILDMYNDIEY